MFETFGFSEEVANWLKEKEKLKSMSLQGSHLTDLNENYLKPAQVINLDKHVGLHGDEIAPGFKRIIAGDGLKDGAVNLVLDHVNNKHQHWQKFVVDTKDGQMGYWQNVEGQIQQHRKENPISKLTAKV